MKPSGLLLIAALCVACDNGNNWPTGTQVLVAPPDAQAAGCQQVSYTAQEDGCRVDWACSEAGLLSLVCAVTDGGASVCACLNGEETVKVLDPSDAGCEASNAPVDRCGFGVKP